MKTDSASDFGLLTTSVASREHADRLARALVEACLAACVQTLAVDSIYRWRGEIEQAAEHLLIVKIRLTDFVTVEALIRSQNDYEIPELVVLPFVAGSSDYLSWLAASTLR